MEFLTLGQVLDNMKYGEIAVPIEVMSGEVPHGNKGDAYCDLAIYFDDYDCYLKTIDGRRINGFTNARDGDNGKYIIVSREQYESMVDRLY